MGIWLSLNYIGKPQAQQRPKHRMIVSKAGKAFTQTYEPSESRNFKATLHVLAQDALKKAGIKPFENAVYLSVHVRVAVPQSISKKKRQQMLNGDILPTKKPDVDNILKAIMDALNGVWYLDDKQVCEVNIYKSYKETDGLNVMAWEMKDEKQDVFQA